MRVPLCRPTLGPEELAAVEEVLASGQLVQASRVERFERACSDRLLGQPVAAVSSGTAALHLALLEVGVGPGDEVVVPALTFPAPANMVELLGATPVLVDVEPETCNLDPRRIEAALSHHTRAVIVVHQFGIPADMAGIRAALRDRPDVVVIEDAACALGARIGDRPCGTLSDIACFSFHPRKVVTTGEGGAVTSSDAERVDRVRSLRNHGLTSTSADGTPGGRFAMPGFNLRMSEIHAAIGLVQLERLAWIVAERRSLAEQYRAALTGCPVRLLEGSFRDGAVVQSLVAVLPEGVDRAALIAALSEREVECTVASYGLHRLPALQWEPRSPDLAAPIADRIHDHGVTLPLYPRMGEDAVAKVAALLTELVHV